MGKGYDDFSNYRTYCLVTGSDRSLSPVRSGIPDTGHCSAGSGPFLRILTIHIPKLAINKEDGEAESTIPL
jgi:hypothetical protein